MQNNTEFDVIIIGGSYAGLSAAMALGRSLRKVLVIDSGDRCNKKVSQAHNFITQDGNSPKDIALKAKLEVQKYETVEFIDGLVMNGEKIDNLFVISLESGKKFQAKKLLFATGLKDIMPDLPGFSECWAVSVLHCPYCHGYEVKNEKLGILGNGLAGFDLAQLISNWSKELVVFTNGVSTFTREQRAKLEEHEIKVIENEISHFDHDEGKIKKVVFKDGSTESVKAVFARIPFDQKSNIPQKMGCELTEHNFIKVDDFLRTTIAGIYAVGDNSNFLRAISLVVASGTKAGVFINHELIAENF